MFRSLIRRLPFQKDEEAQASEDPFADPPEARNPLRRFPNINLSMGMLGKGPGSMPSYSSDELGLSSNAWQHPHPSPIRSTPPNVAWLPQNDSEDTDGTDASSEHTVIRPPAPAAIHRPLQAPALSRSNSLPNSTSTLRSSAGPSTPKWSLRLQTGPSFASSTQSLRLDSRHSSLGEEMYGAAYAYPLVKQLSPILEQLSPSSTRSNPLNRMCELETSVSNRSPNGSQFSDVTRPSPIFSHTHPFITRPINRTVSQSSSRTHVSTTSTLPREPPNIPPLDLRPAFPGPLRPPKSATTPTMPTIAGSEEDDTGAAANDSSTSHYSLHADSFVTATDAMESPAAEYEIPLGTPVEPMSGPAGQRAGEGRRALSLVATCGTSEHPSAPSARPSSGQPSSAHPSSSHSISSAFIYQRWERDAAFGTGSVTFPRVKKRRFDYTPACWMFWLCFLCPPLWFVGGWYITIFAEAYTFRDPDDDWHWWGVRNRAARQWKGKMRALELPQWVREKQQVSDGSSSTGRALRGISYLYPFVARPINPPPSKESMGARLLRTLGKANLVLDWIPYVKLEEVDGEKETDRRMFDPWIQRCRYAWCWFFVLWCCVGVPSLFIIRQYCSTCLRDV